MIKNLFKGKTVCLEFFCKISFVFLTIINLQFYTHTNTPSVIYLEYYISHL